MVVVEDQRSCVTPDSLNVYIGDPIVLNQSLLGFSGGSLSPTFHGPAFDGKLLESLRLQLQLPAPRGLSRDLVTLLCKMRCLFETASCRMRYGFSSVRRQSPPDDSGSKLFYSSRLA